MPGCLDTADGSDFDVFSRELVAEQRCLKLDRTEINAVLRAGCRCSLVVGSEVFLCIK